MSATSATPSTTTSDYPMIPSVPLKEMNAAMLSFELTRETDRLFADEPQQHEMVISAAMLATHLHRDQTRFVRDNFPRVPYIEHPLRVALRLIRGGATDAELVAAALLHDTVEDCVKEIVETYALGLDLRLGGSHAIDQSTALSWISRTYSPAVSFTVMWVTNVEGGSYLGHLQELASHGVKTLAPLLVKASDLVDNAGSLIYQFGTVPLSFIIKMLRKYVPAVTIVNEALRAIQLESPDSRDDVDSAIVALTLLSNQLEEVARLVADALEAEDAD
jgi:hypothetical protein